jgi:predicted HD phosphohydrolase
MTEPSIARHKWTGDVPDGTVTFTAMADGTAEDYALLERFEQTYVAALPERVTAALQRLDQSIGGYQISRLQHSLQAATRARRDGADSNWVVAALVHDLGDELAPHNHSAIAASLLQPYVPAEVHWVVLHHGIFQSYYYAHFYGGDRHERDRYRSHQWAPLCEEFCERWDQSSFDPDYPTDSLDSFTDQVDEVFSRVVWDPVVTGTGSQRLY